MSTARAKLAQNQLAPALPARIFNHAAGEFADNFNRRSFAVSHNLGNHPLFEVSRLQKLAETLFAKTGRTVFFTDSPGLDQGWNRSKHRGASLARAFSSLDQTNSWILLKSIQEEPEYKLLLDNCLAELQELTAVPLLEQITWVDAYVFIASPNTVTPYHIDHESNFLLQIHGDKEVNLFDPNDPTILTDQEIEQYYIGDLSGAKYREENQAKAKIFKITPGTGVHHPVRAPHWVRNGNTYSISLSVLFFMREFDLQARVYQANHFLRKLKMTPTSPGKSLLKDKVKTLMLSDFGRKPKSKSEVIRFAVTKYIAAAGLGQKLMQKVGVGKQPSAQQSNGSSGGRAAAN